MRSNTTMDINTVREKPISDFSDEYQHLINLETFIQTMEKTEDVESMLRTIVRHAFQINLQDRFNETEIQQFHENQQLIAVSAKIDALLQKRGILMEGGAVACHMAKGFVKIPGVMEAFAQAFTAGSSAHQSAVQATMAEQDYLGQRNATLINELGQKIQEANREGKEELAKMLRLIQDKMRLVETILSK